MIPHRSASTRTVDLRLTVWSPAAVVLAQMEKLLKRIVAPGAVALGILAIWQFGVITFGVSEVVLPSPLAIARALFSAAPLLLKHTVPTTVEVIVGFFIAASGGIALATLLAVSKIIRDALFPSVLFFQLIPKIALAPLFILWFGIGSSSRLAFIAFISFFPVVLGTLTGLLSTPPDLLMLCRACSARTSDVFIHVRFPSAMPMIFSGLKISVTFAIVGVIVGEFISAQSGLGYLVLFASSQADTPLAMAAITLICIVGLGIYGMVVWVESIVLSRLGAK